MSTVVSRAVKMKFSMLLSTLLTLIGAAGTLDLFDADGQRVGVVREGLGGSVEVFDAESRRVGWGRRNADGSVELFDMKGNRVGTITRDRIIRQGKPIGK